MSEVFCRWTCLVAVVVSGICSVPVVAQTLPNLLEIDETEVISVMTPYDLGDVDGDGCDDIGIVARANGFAPGLPFRAAVYSGKTGQLIYDLFPWASSGVLDKFIKTPDLDGDGLAEIAYTSSGFIGFQFRVILSTSPTVTTTIPLGSALGGQEIIKSVGDLTGDGVSDWAISRANTSLLGLASSHIDIIDGANYSVTSFWALFNVTLTPGGLVGIGDVDGDGVPDIAASSGETSFLAPNGGSASVFSGQTGLEIRSWFGQAGDRLGHQLIGVGDLDGDGATDIAVSEPSSNVAFPFSGRVRVFSTNTGLALLDFQPNAGELILGIFEAGDHDGDGIKELGLTIFNSATSTVTRELRSCADGSTILQPVPFLVGDLNGDWIDDLIGLAPNVPSAGQTRITAFTLVGAREYGSSPGAPSFKWEPGVLVPTLGSMALTGAASFTSIIGIVSFAPADTLVPGTPFPLFVSADPADLYGTFFFVTNSQGEHYDFVNLAQPGLSGLRAYIQYGVLGAVPITTNAIEILFGP